MHRTTRRLGRWDRERALELCGGAASRRQLIAMGVDSDVLDLGLYYQRILRVRIGWYALPDASPAVVHAVRAGGRLACVSALEWHAGREPAHPLHVMLERGRHARAVDSAVVIHWTRRGDDRSVAVVSADLARRQAARCGRKAPKRLGG